TGTKKQSTSVRTLPASGGKRGWNELETEMYCHDQWQHDDVLRCRRAADWLCNGHRQTLKGKRLSPGMTCCLSACPMTQTTKIRFTEQQIALLMRAHPNCNLDHLTELSFEFDQVGKIVDCIGTIKDGVDIDHDYVGSGLARLYETACRQLATRQGSATIL